MARSRSVLVILIALAICVSAQEPPRAPDPAPRFELPPGAPPPPPRPPGNDHRPDHRPPHQLPPEAQAMKDQAKKEFEKMSPEQRQKFWGNFKAWLDMPAEQRDRITKMHSDRMERARNEIEEIIKRSGLELSETQRKDFAARYFEERRLIEERLRKEMEDRRWPLLAAMEELLKAEFSKPAAAEKPAETK
jgi:hypothetical protein